MNKKGLSAIVATSLIILLTISGIALIYEPIVTLLNKEKFNITIEECRWETITNQYYADMVRSKTNLIMEFHKDYREQGCLYYWRYGILNESILCLKMHEESQERQREIGEYEELKHEEIEVCEEVEVKLEEFYGYDYCDIKGYGKDCYESFDLRTIEEREAFRLNRKEISIEWLNENCEIIKSCSPSEKGYCIQSYDEDAEYFKYQCGDYKFEVTK